MENRSFNNLTAVILDDHKLFADSFSKLVEFLDFFRTVNVFYHEKDLMQHLVRFRTSDTIYLFVEYYLEGRTLPQFVNDIRRLSRNIRIIVVSSLNNAYLLHDLLKYSPDGIISKIAPANEVINCIHEVAQGRSFICPEIKNLLDNHQEDTIIPFTQREIELLQYFVQGFSINDAALKLNLSKHTIAAHRRKMMSKTHTTSITGLLAVAKKYEVI